MPRAALCDRGKTRLEMAAIAGKNGREPFGPAQLKVGRTVAARRGHGQIEDYVLMADGIAEGRNVALGVFEQQDELACAGTHDLDAVRAGIEQARALVGVRVDAPNRILDAGKDGGAHGEQLRRAVPAGQSAAPQLVSVEVAGDERMSVLDERRPDEDLVAYGRDGIGTGMVTEPAPRAHGEPFTGGPGQPGRVLRVRVAESGCEFIVGFQSGSGDQAGLQRGADG